MRERERKKEKKRKGRDEGERERERERERRERGEGIPKTLARTGSGPVGWILLHADNTLRVQIVVAIVHFARLFTRRIAALCARRGEQIYLRHTAIGDA